MSAGLIAAALGIAQGARHALEPDHLAAVSTLAQERPGPRGGFLVGASWGVGHTLSLLLVGGTLAAFEAELPVRAAAIFELLVAVMLVVLGVRAVWLSLQEGRAGHEHAHRHGPMQHVHAAPVAHLHAGRWTLSTRPLVIGMVHGLAGSGAISALVLARLPGVASRLMFIALFGLGSILAMAAMSAVAGAPLVGLRRAPVWAARLMLTAGLMSVGLGLWWGWAALQVA